MGSTKRVVVPCGCGAEVSFDAERPGQVFDRLEEWGWRYFGGSQTRFVLVGLPSWDDLKVDYRFLGSWSCGSGCPRNMTPVSPVAGREEDATDEEREDWAAEDKHDFIKEGR